MSKFPVDAPLQRVMRAFARLGFTLARPGNHLALVRVNADGTNTPLSLPNHRNVNSKTLRTILTQGGVSREDFLRAYEQA